MSKTRQMCLQIAGIVKDMKLTEGALYKGRAFCYIGGPKIDVCPQRKIFKHKEGTQRISAYSFFRFDGSIGQLTEHNIFNQ